MEYSYVLFFISHPHTHTNCLNSFKYMQTNINKKNEINRNSYCLLIIIHIGPTKWTNRP